MSRNKNYETDPIDNMNLIYERKGVKKEYNLVCICFHNSRSDLKDFLRDNTILFDGIVIIDCASISDINIISELHHEPKLIAYYRSDDNFVEIERISKFILQNIKADWVCFLYSNERFIKGYDNLKKVCDGLFCVRQLCIILSSEDESKYFIKNRNKYGVEYENRLFSFDSISKINIEDIKSPLLLQKYINNDEWHKYKISFFTKKNDISELFYKNDEFVNFNIIPHNIFKCQLTNEVSEISDFFIKRTDYFKHIGILGGESGSSLLLAQLFLKTRKPIYITKLNENLNFIIDVINKASDKEPITPYFSNGIAGFGWLLCYIKEHNIIEIPNYLFEQMDNILSDSINQNPDMPWDILHGKLGIVRYFLKRCNRELVANTLYYLQKTAIIDNNEYRWLSQDHFHLTVAGHNFDCGLAHGMAGILYFLSKAYELGIERELCLKLGNGIIMFYFNNEQDIRMVGSYFPNRVMMQKTSTTPPQFSRLAWCYGDLGILYSIYLYYHKIGNSEGMNDIVKKLQQTTLRKNCDFNGVHDAMICHGSAGIAHIYNRLYFMTDLIEFKEAAFYWLRVSLKISRDESVSPPFKFVVSAFSSKEKSNKPKWDESLGLLEGVIGLELVLLSFYNYRHMDWDEVIMLS